MTVDLQAGTAQLLGRQRLSRQAVAQAVENAGFSLLEMSVKEPAGDLVRSSSWISVLELRASVAEIEHGGVTPTLEMLGALVAERGGRIAVTAPENREEGLLKPLLMGRQTAVPVRFQAAASASADEVVIRWMKPAAP